MGSKISAWISAAAVFAFGPGTVAAAFAAEPTFRIGDAAPAIAPVTWLKGGPVASYARGHVYVIEFWATWCPPCLKSIPHLSELQRRHPRALTIIGVNAEGLLGFDAKPHAVGDFMERHGKDMAYTVAVEDPAGQPISSRWVTATGAMGAPTAAIVDQRGKLVWIGYPDMAKGYAFDQALEDALAGRVDISKSRALQSKLSRETESYRTAHSRNPS